MNTIWVTLAIYLALGLVAIAVLDLTTKRVRRRLLTAAYDTQQLIGESRKVAIVVTTLALWALWPVAIYGALTPGKASNDDKGGGDGEEE